MPNRKRKRKKTTKAKITKQKTDTIVISKKMG